MRKLIFLCHRLPSISHEQYTEQLLRSHIPIALRHHPSMRRYVVNEVTTGFLPGPRELDSVGELSFASLADYRERLYDSDEGRATAAYVIKATAGPIVSDASLTLLDRIIGSANIDVGLLAASADTFRRNNAILVKVFARL